MAVPDDLVAIAERRLRRRGRIDSLTGCLEYQGATIRGYGNINMNRPGVPRLVHRLAWELWVGPIPEGVNVLHRCDNPPCFNIDHLYLGTQSENMRDRHARSPESTAKGEQLRRKLKIADVLQIRELAAQGHTIRAIQRLWFPFITHQTVQNITSRHTWKHI